MRSRRRSAATAALPWATPRSRRRRPQASSRRQTLRRRRREPGAGRRARAADMATMSELTARLEALRAARANGFLRVNYPGVAETTFRSMDELTRAIGFVEDEIAS